MKKVIDVHASGLLGARGPRSHPHLLHQSEARPPILHLWRQVVHAPQYPFLRVLHPVGVLGIDCGPAGLGVDAHVHELDEEGVDLGLFYCGCHADLLAEVRGAVTPRQGVVRFQQCFSRGKGMKGLKCTQNYDEKE